MVENQSDAQDLIHQASLTAKSKAVVTQRVKQDGTDAGQSLEGAAATSYRSSHGESTCSRGSDGAFLGAASGSHLRPPLHRYSDSDFAGCGGARKSTSCAAQHA